MSDVLKLIGHLVLSCFGLAVIFVIGWFVIGMCICFYKIHINKKPKNKPKEVVIQECYKGHGLCDCPEICRENC